MEQIAFVSSGFYHPPLLGRWFLRQALSELDGYAFRKLRSLEELPNDMNLFSALVANLLLCTWA